MEGRKTYRFLNQDVLAAALVLASPAPVAAQQPSGVLQGAVTVAEQGGAATGTAVHGAVVLIVGTNLVGLTDEDGAFEFANVPAGVHEVLAQREHLTAGRQVVIVDAGGTATIDFELGLSPVHEDVTVTASAGGEETTFEAFNAVTTLDSFDVVQDPHGTLGDALQNEPGIANRSFGPAASRPIIRGFDNDRVLILEDGIRTGDLSSTSGDHGVAIDPAGAERIEILRGPATLLYGSNAVGGLVNVITPHESYRESLFDGTRAQFGVDTGSANRQAGTNAGLQHARGGAVFWGSGSVRRSDDYETPAGPVDNSASRLTNVRAGAGWFGDRLFASGGVTAEDGRYGIPFAGMFHSHDHGHGDHDDDHDDHGDEGVAEESEDIDLDFRRRAGRFDVGLRNLDNRVVEGVRVTLNVVDWNHDEIELGQGVERIGTQFANRAWIVRADVDQRRTDRLSGRFGAWMQFRDFEATGAEALTPPVDQNSFAAFAYEALDFGRYRVQFGGRVERNDYRTGLRTGGHGHDDAGHDDDHDDDHREAPDPRNRQFLGASASIGLHTDLGAGGAMVANVTRSHRVPALEELYRFGPHAGTRSFDIGDPGLEAETTLGFDLSFRHRIGRVRGDFNFYVYDVDGFIYGDRTTGEIRDDLQVLYFEQGDSRFVGFDATGSVRLGGQAWATLGLGLVDATLWPTGEPLPFIPPLRGTLRLDLPYGGFTVSPRLMFAARQDNVHRGETETAGYAVFDLLASYVWPRQHMSHALTLVGYNLTNVLYRNHTSYIKELAPEMGRGIKVGYSLRFF